MLPEYERHGPKLAPIMRNREIAEGCSVLVAFWDGESRGTADAIEQARQRGRQVILYGPDGQRMGT
jgi:hypothetical protein